MMNILIVVTAFYPEQAIGSIRTTKFAKYLQKSGASVSVISLAPTPWSVRDESLYYPELETINWRVVDQSKFFKFFFHNGRTALVGRNSALANNNDGVFASLKYKIKMRIQFFYTLLKALDWMVCVRSYARKELSGNKFDLIYTSYPSFASPFSGVMLKKMKLSKCLLIDFRDPVESLTTGNFFSIKRWVQKKLVSYSDFRLYASDGVKKSIVGGCTAINDVVINNGFDQEDIVFDDCNSCGKFDVSVLRFAYTGNLYGEKRNLQPFFHALSEVLKSKHYPYTSVSLEYAGGDSETFKRYADDYGLLGAVIDHGRVSRSESLEIQQRSDICLLATWNTESEQGVLTGKIFEYFMVRKPILAIVSGNCADSEVYKVINTTGAGFCYECADESGFDDMLSWIKAALEEKRKHGSVASRYNDSVSNYELGERVFLLRKELDKFLSIDDE